MLRLARVCGSALAFGLDDVVNCADKVCIIGDNRIGIQCVGTIS